MQVRCFEIGADGRARGVELDDVVNRQRDEVGSSWIDVESPTRDEAAALLAGLGLAGELVEELLERGHAARTIPFEGGLIFELPLEIAGQPAELKSAAFVRLDRTLVTIRDAVSDTTSWVGDGRALQLDLGDGSTSSLVSALLIELSVRLRRRSLDARRTLVELADRLDDDPESVPLDEIIRAKRAVFDLDAISEEREATIESLQVVERYFRSSPDAIDGLGIALGNTAATTRRLDRLDRRADALQARIESVERERIDRRLSRLTIISAIFLPLTLIAGIYGMNFEVMPELRYPLAYPLTIAGMVVLGLGLLWWFRRSGWMD
jgi:Mg2+ and Co2+ transporter CorA